MNTAINNPNQVIDAPPPNLDTAYQLGSSGVVLADVTVNPAIAGIEQSRKDIVNRNLNALKKRFGEEFVKGKRLGSGEYAGGGAREVLSSFMEKPDFATELKRIIPNTHQALDTLRDNQDYVLALLEDRYNNDTDVEKEPPKDPYELAKQAGYELTGPFESVEDFADYASDFRGYERICTFNNPHGRLTAYNILCLRHDEADTILPADELTQETLTKPWQDYLKTIGRYDAISTSYNLEGLQPTREDPYGTSSMSVQISRRGSHVSIKNRYNNTVASPDSTYKNNLDNVAYGLKPAVYHQVGREDLLSIASQQELHEDYITDNKGGIHRYYQETNNIYLGYFEYIENGGVKTIDKGAYDMLAPNLYISKNGNGEVIQLGNTVDAETDKTSFEILEGGTRRLYIYDENGKLQQTYSYGYDDKNKITSVSLSIAEGAKTGYIYRNPTLTKLTIAEGAKTGSIYRKILALQLKGTARDKRIYLKKRLKRARVRRTG